MEMIAPFQVSRMLLVSGIVALVLGVIGYASRRQSWREAVANVQREEQLFERRAQLQERWLLRFLRRHRTPSSASPPGQQ